MPLEIKYIDNGLGALFSGSGVVTGQELTNINEFESEEYNKCKYWLYDFSETEIFDVSSEEIKTVASQDLSEAKEDPDIIGAVVAPKDLIYGLVRMWEIYSEKTGWNVMVLRSRAEAETWIQKQLNMELTFK